MSNTPPTEEDPRLTVLSGWRWQLLRLQLWLGMKRDLLRRQVARLVWPRRVLAYPLFAVLAIAQLAKRWWQGRCSAFGRWFWSFRGSGRCK